MRSSSTVRRCGVGTRTILFEPSEQTVCRIDGALPLNAAQVPRMEQAAQRHQNNEVETPESGLVDMRFQTFTRKVRRGHMASGSSRTSPPRGKTA